MAKSIIVFVGGIIVVLATHVCISLLFGWLFSLVLPSSLGAHLGTISLAKIVFVLGIFIATFSTEFKE